MTTQILISELKQALQGQTVRQERDEKGNVINITEMIVNDPIQRKKLSEKLSQLLLKIEPSDSTPV